jgi:hypothetical protein
LWTRQECEGERRWRSVWSASWKRSYAATGGDDDGQLNERQAQADN